MSLSTAVAKISEAIKDLSSLHVQTYTGSVNVDLSTVAAGKLAIDTVRETIAEEAGKPEGTIKLVAEAYYQFDGDSYNFLTSDAIPEGALEMHSAAVEAGIKTRQGLVELVKGAIK
jgi:hypothetical protein